MERPRSQQYELYAAEVGVPVGRTFANLEEIQNWVDALRDEPWWYQRYPEVLRIEVGPAINGGKDGSVGWYEPDKAAGRIEMAPVHWYELAVVHEMSHVFARLRGSKAHDPIFARTYLNLTYLIMGSDVYQALFTAFTRDGIDSNWTEPTPMVMRHHREWEG